MARVPKTTGSRGIHLYVRLEPRGTASVRAAAVALARELERRRPDLITAAWWKEERGRARVRRLQPERTAQDGVRRVVGAAAARGAGVDAVPLGRAGALDPDVLTIATARRGSPSRGDPWVEMDDAPQSLEPLLECSARDMAAGLMDAPWPPVYPKKPNEPPRVAPSRARKT